MLAVKPRRWSVIAQFTPKKWNSVIHGRFLSFALMPEPKWNGKLHQPTKFGEGMLPGTVEWERNKRHRRASSEPSLQAHPDLDAPGLLRQHREMAVFSNSLERRILTPPARTGGGTISQQRRKESKQPQIHADSATFGRIAEVQSFFRNEWRSACERSLAEVD
jgi:hypothetical protein